MAVLLLPFLANGSNPDKGRAFARVSCSFNATRELVQTKLLTATYSPPAAIPFWLWQCIFPIVGRSAEVLGSARSSFATLWDLRHLLGARNFWAPARLVSAWARYDIATFRSSSGHTHLALPAPTRLPSRSLSCKCPTQLRRRKLPMISNRVIQAPVAPERPA